MATTAKDGSPSPGRRQGRGMKKQEESEPEEIPKTEVQLMVETYAGRVSHRLNEEYGILSPSDLKDV